MEKDRGNYEEAAALFEAGVTADPGHLYLWQAWGCMEADRVRTERREGDLGDLCPEADGVSRCVWPGQGMSWRIQAVIYSRRKEPP